MNRYYPVIKNQDKILRKICERELSKTFPQITKQIKKRLEFELDVIKKSGMAFDYIYIYKIIKKLKIKKYQIFCNGELGNSIVAYLCKISNINPLGQVSRICYGTIANPKQMRIALHILPEYSNKFLKEYSNISKDYFIKRFSRFSSPFWIVLPKNSKKVCKELMIHNLNSFLEKDGSFEDIYRIFHVFYFDNWSDLDMVNMLAKLTKKEPDKCIVSFDDENVVNYLNNLSKNDKRGILNGYSESALEVFFSILNSNKISCFDDLVKIFGMAFGTGTWNNKIAKQLSSNKISLGDIIATQDDVYDMAIKQGYDETEAYEITELTDKRKHYKSPNEEDLLKNKVLKKKYKDIFNFLKGIDYLPPRGQAIQYAKLTWWLVWYKVYYRKEFDVAYKKIKRL